MMKMGMTMMMNWMQMNILHHPKHPHNFSMIALRANLLPAIIIIFLGKYPIGLEDLCLNISTNEESNSLTSFTGKSQQKWITMS